MIAKTLTSLALVAGSAMALAVSAAQGQVIDTQEQLRTPLPRLQASDRVEGFSDRNIMDSAQYEHLLRTSPAFRQSRMMKECGSLTVAHLRAGCMDSFSAYEDRRSMDLRDGLTGGGDGRMNPIDRTFQGPEMYDPRFGR
jgi:hypothetical protein